MKLNREERIKIQKEINETRMNKDTKDLLNRLLDDSKMGLKLYFEESEEMIKNEFGIDVNISKQNYIYFEEDRTKRLKNIDNLKSHILIEGDNYFALKHLKRIGQKVDLIYIDPPYNTGKEFTYNDKLIREDDSFKHSYWLSFMKKRLKLAKELLSKQGAIFISIDDNEQAYLKVLMDEIFGESNFISNLVWLKKNAQNDANNFQKNYEYILVYSNKFSKNLITSNVKINNKMGSGIGLTIGGGFKSKSLKHHKDTGQTIYWNKQTSQIKVEKDYDFEKIITGSEEISEIYQDNQNLIENGYIPIRPPRFEFDGKLNLGRWTWGVEKMIENIDNLMISEKNNKIIVMRKDNREHSILPFNNYIDDVPSSKGTKELNEISDINFSNPKSVHLLKKIIQFINVENPVILDFFTGSGTTGQAVMELNKLDNKKRRFIGITLGKEKSELNICEKIAYERLHRINEGFGTKGESDFKWLTKNEPYKQNLKYLRVKHLNKFRGNLNELNINKDLYKEEFDLELNINLIADE